jgi:hypothetical protein
MYYTGSFENLFENTNHGGRGGNYPKSFSGPEIETLTKPGNPNVAWLEFSTLS